MKFTIPSSILASLLLLNNVEARWKPKQGSTWNYVLEDNVNLKNEKAEILDIDLEGTSKSTIKKYHDAGKKVICYFSGGTIEEYREDYKKYEAVKGLVRNRYSKWDDERWLDIRKEGIKPLIKNRMKLAVEKKCDAIEVDNLDGWQQKDIMKVWSNPLSKNDAIKFAKWLGNTAHELGISIGLKNSLFMINEVGSYFDFAINESCATLSNPECHLYRSFLNQGKAVFGVSYKDHMKSKSVLCKNLNGLNISMIIKKRQELVQDYTVFNGKKECGSSFNTGSNASSDKKPVTTKKTTVKKTTTKKSVVTTVKKTTKKTSTTSVKKTTKKTPTTSVKKTTKKTPTTSIKKTTKKITTKKTTTTSKKITTSKKAKSTTNPVTKKSDKTTKANNAKKTSIKKVKKIIVKTVKVKKNKN